MEQGWNVSWCNVNSSFCFAWKHKSLQHGNQAVNQTSLGTFLLNNTNFSTGAHVSAPQYDHYLTQAVDSCFVLIGLINMAYPQARGLSSDHWPPALHGCHCQGDMAVHMRKVVAILRSWYVCCSAKIEILFHWHNFINNFFKFPGPYLSLRSW